MDSYIVRVLRRTQTNLETGENGAVHLDGVVEAVDENGEHQAFHGIDELWSILASSDGGKQAKSGAATNNKTR